jgi:hypothetical protein
LYILLYVRGRWAILALPLVVEVVIVVIVVVVSTVVSTVVVIIPLTDSPIGLWSGSPFLEVYARGTCASRLSYSTLSDILGLGGGWGDIRHEICMP